MCVCKNPQGWGTGPHLCGLGPIPTVISFYTASILLHEIGCIMRQANQKPGPKTRDRTTQCTIKRQTITTLRRVSASGLTGSGWPLDRLVPLQLPAPHSKARVCLRGEEKERRVLGIEMAFVRGHMHWLLERLYTAVPPPIPQTQQLENPVYTV